MSKSDRVLKLPETDHNADPPSRREAEDRLEPLARAGDTLHDYLVGVAALIGRGAGDWVDVLHAIEALTAAQRSTRRAHEHLINAMADSVVRLDDPLAAAAAVQPDAEVLQTDQ